MKKIKAKKMSSPKNEIVLMNGKGAMTVEGMERIFKALTGRDFTPSDRETAQKKLDDHAASEKSNDLASEKRKPSFQSSCRWDGETALINDNLRKAG